MAQINDVKVVGRINSTAFDAAEIAPLIAAAKAELKLAGVLPSLVDSETPDPLIDQAIKFYVKAYFGLENAETEKYAKHFADLKALMACVAEYTEAVS